MVKSSVFMHFFLRYWWSNNPAILLDESILAYNLWSRNLRNFIFLTWFWCKLSHYIKSQYRYTKVILLVASESSYCNKVACTNTMSSISNASLARLVRLSTFAEDSTKFKKVIREVAANENRNLYQTYSEHRVFAIILLFQKVCHYSSIK